MPLLLHKRWKPTEGSTNRDGIRIRNNCLLVKGVLVDKVTNGTYNSIASKPSSGVSFSPTSSPTAAWCYFGIFYVSQQCPVQVTRHYWHISVEWNKQVFQFFIFNSECHIFAITETWLSHFIKDSEIITNEYKIYRKDRDSRGGGVLLIVSAALSSRLLPIPNQLELLAVQLLLPCLVTFCVFMLPLTLLFPTIPHFVIFYLLWET